MYDQYGEDGVKAADQMGDDAPHGFGGMPHGFSSHGGSPHMSQEDAQRVSEFDLVVLARFCSLLFFIVLS